MDDKSESHYFYKLLKLNGTVLTKYIVIEKKEIKEKYILTKTAEVWDNWKRYVPFLFLSY